MKRITKKLKHENIKYIMVIILLFWKIPKIVFENVPKIPPNAAQKMIPKIPKNPIQEDLRSAKSDKQMRDVFCMQYCSAMEMNYLQPCRVQNKCVGSR